MESGGGAIAELEAVTQNEENNYDAVAGKGLSSVLQCPVNGFIFFSFSFSLHIACNFIFCYWEL